MALTLASDMAHKSLGTLLERVERQREFSSDQARELIASCEVGSLALERCWQLVQEFLSRGMERRQLIFFLKELLDGIELGLKAFNVAHTRIKAADLTSEEKADSVGLVERVSRRSVEMRDELSALLRWLETPQPAIDPLTLPAGRGNRDAEGYVNLDDLTRLLNRDP